jgi:4-amino-4-deoxychorismate lyase
MSLLVETIRIEDGAIMNLGFHNERYARTLYGIYGVKSSIDLGGAIIVPEYALRGIFKCRVLYDDKSLSTEFAPYIFRSVGTLRMIFEEGICYPYKYTNRDKLNRLYDRRGDCDDILIIKSGLVTDSSYANVILRDKDGSWITPTSFLLPGTRRASLLKSGLIREKIIRAEDITDYTELKLINAMRGIDDSHGIAIGNILR